MTTQPPIRLSGAAAHLMVAWLTLSFFLFSGAVLLTPSLGTLGHALKAVFFLPALILLIRHYRRTPNNLFDDLNLALLAFFILGLVSLFWAAEPRWTRMTHAMLQIAVLFLTCRTLGQHHRPLLARALVLSALLSAVVAGVIMVLFYRDNPPILPLYEVRTGLEGLIPNTNQLIATMTMMSPTFILAGALVAEQQVGRRILLALGLTVCALFLIALQRRTGLVALLGGGVALILLTRSKRIILALVAIIIATSYFIVTDANHYISRGDSERIAVWLSYLEVTGHHPWFGHGLSDNIPTITPEQSPILPYAVFHPHNILLSLFYYLGAAGLVVFAVFVIILLRRLLVSRAAFEHKNLVFLAPLAPGLITLMFDGEKVITPFWPNWNCLWIPLALAAATLARTASNSPESDASHAAPCDESGTAND
ncbi:O-antigen ligase family protein [Alloalcanivorax xenomutans]|jgi:O-antigen ligase|uniref:O-antigen ligase family protein n=1 Tax=Alloalcanivorax xenomutans TaxID=1094342 RepID=UPI0003B8FDF4|nr:hypothetical protein Q668_20785 [Alcanivorax sp. PN-3]